LRARRRTKSRVAVSTASCGLTPIAAGP
jgi:hypothetical protein